MNSLNFKTYLSDSCYWFIVSRAIGCNNLNKTKKLTIIYRNHNSFQIERTEERKNIGRGGRYNVQNRTLYIVTIKMRQGFSVKREKLPLKETSMSYWDAESTAVNFDKQAFGPCPCKWGKYSSTRKSGTKLCSSTLAPPPVQPLIEPFYKYGTPSPKWGFSLSR